MNKKILLRILIILAVLIIGGWAVYQYGIPALKKSQQSNGQSSPITPVTYQTTRARSGGGEETITTTGAIRSEQTAVLIWQTTGTVSNVNVVVGQMVEKDTILAELEETSLPQVVILARAELVDAQDTLDTLLTSTQPRANAQMALVKAQQELEDALEDRDSLLFQRASNETIDISRARLIEANEALEDAEKFFDHNNSDETSLEYAAALSRLAKARQEQTQAEYNLDYASGLPDPLDIEEADARITVAEANVLQAKLDWEKVKDGPDENDVTATEARIAAAQATLNLARITAPFDGTLTLVDSKAGDQIVSGMTAFQLDDLNHLYLDVAVIEDEIGRIQTGQPVTIYFDALPGSSYSGVVTEIAAFGKATAGTVNFTVTVEILSSGTEIKPGMTASVNIVTGQSNRTLLVPTSAIHTLDGQTVVYLLKNGEPVPVAVVTGSASGNDTTITAGALTTGDLVVLNVDIPSASISTIIPLPTEETRVITASPTLIPTPVSTSEPSNTDEDLAVETVRNYFLALEQGDFQSAAGLYSDFSLMLDGMTRSEAALELQDKIAAGTTWSSLEIKDTRRFDDHTILVHVTYHVGGNVSTAEDTGANQETQMDQLWPIRWENGEWLYNRENLIDFRLLDITEQTTGGLTVKPLRLIRYSNRMRLSLMVQNNTNEAIVLGQSNEILALFQFKDQQVEAVNKQMIFNRLRTNPEVFIEVEGLFESYPESVTIRNWKNYNVEPWFTFQFTGE